MKQVSVNGSRINLFDQGSGHPILLVHGFPLDFQMWQYQLEPLSETGRVICPDLPGFGNSQAWSEPIHLRGLADFLAALLDELDVEQVTFCGLSMGGYIGWQFWQHHRQRLDRLIASNTRAAADTEAVSRARRVSAQSLRKDGTSILADEMPYKLFAESSIQNRADDVNLIRQVIRNSDAEILAQAQIAMSQRPDATNWLSEIDVPTLFVAGQHDSITTPEEISSNQKKVPDSRLVLLENAGHLAPLENPEAFNAAVNNFIQ